MKNKFLIVHCHTTGLNFTSDDITTNHQPLSIALGIFNKMTCTLDDKVYVKIAFDPKKYSWDSKLENIHGFNKIESEYGESFTDSATILGEFIFNHFGFINPIQTMGYNVQGLHLPFLQKILNSEDLKFKFSNKNIDLYIISTLFGLETVNKTFEFFGLSEENEQLTSTQIIQYSSRIYKYFHKLVQSAIEDS